MGASTPPAVPPALAGKASVAVVGVVALVATGLLFRTQSNAADIRVRTARIAASAEGINSYTDAVLKLDETNRLAASILHSVQPISAPLKRIEGQSSDIADIMRSIRTSTTSIDGSATSIRGSAAAIRDGMGEVGASARAIGTSLGGVSGDTARILADLRLIRAGVALIGSDLGATRALVAQILADAGGIDTAAVRARHLTACIDNGLNGRQKCGPTQ